MAVKLLQFIDEVVKESKKISWAPKKEVMQITGLVFVVVAISAVFFLGVDMLVYNIIQYLLKVGR